jgi:hypothetical protein
MFGAHSASLRRFLLIAGLFSSFGVHAVAAQVSGPDTVYYREVATVQMTHHLPSGPSRLNFKQDGLIGLRALRPGVAQAWFEELEMTLSTPDGSVRVPTDGMLRQLYVLHFDSAGHPTPVRTPVAPEWVRAIVDHTKQFQDFFMPMPRLPLTRGLVWVDTLELEGIQGVSRTVRTFRVGRYEVIGDSTIRGVAVFVVRGTLKQRVHISGPIAGGGGLESVNQQEGTDNSRFYIAKHNMRMMARSSSGSYKGFVEFDGAIKLPTTMTYSGRIDLDPRERRHLTMTR